MEQKSFEKQATRVSMVSIIGNLVLSVIKFLAGILANSQAMLSDAVHSSSDVLSSIVVIVGVRLSAKESDKEHPYGHERMECVAAIVLATILCFTGISIGYFALTEITSGNYQEIKTPGLFALAAAILSIVTKEAMFWYTRYFAKSLDSGALMADAWHHRSDALSSVGALIGIAGARMGYPILEPVASLVICVFISKAAVEIYRDALDKMVDKSCDPMLEDEVRELVLKQDGVLGIDVLHTRMFGNKIYVDLEISADGERPLKETHAVAEQVHNVLEETYPKIKHIMVHVNPMELSKTEKEDS